MKLIGLLAVVALAAVGCRRENTVSKQYDKDVVLRVSVLKSGEILADGDKVSLQELESLIAANTQKNGVVWYYREAGKEEPPTQAMEVIQLVVRYKRPLQMSSKADFSDTIDENGNSVPRMK